MAKQPRRQRLPGDDESRAAVALTVAWMLTCLSTAAGLVLVLALRLWMTAFPRAPGGAHPLQQMAAVLLFVTVATGALCLVFTPLAIRVRQTPPPRAITIAAVVIGVLLIVAVVIGSIGAITTMTDYLRHTHHEFRQASAEASPIRGCNSSWGSSAIRSAAATASLGGCQIRSGSR
jgi:NAD/NADP transhydrogenase beta subunit